MAEVGSDKPNQPLAVAPDSAEEEPLPEEKDREKVRLQMISDISKGCMSRPGPVSLIFGSHPRMHVARARQGSCAQLSFLAFPVPVRLIILNELCERFSYYGMRAILSLFILVGSTAGARDPLG